MRTVLISVPEGPSSYLFASFLLLVPCTQPTPSLLSSLLSFLSSSLFFFLLLLSRFFPPRSAESVPSFLKRIAHTGSTRIPPLVSSRKKQTKLEEIALAASFLPLFVSFCFYLSTQLWLGTEGAPSRRAACSNSFSTEDEREHFHPGDWS